MNANRTLLSFSAALALGVGCAFTSTTADATGYRDFFGLRMIGLTADQRLISFHERFPGFARSVGYVNGLAGDSALIGIDYRVQDGQLYGVGNAGGVYVINAGTGAASKVSQLTIVPSGAAFGVDFNPAADRLRVVSDTGQNLRHNVNAGGVTLKDGDLSYAPGTVASGIVGAAYTNNDLDANTATTLFDIDFALDQVVVQSPANSGTLAATGKLGVDAAAAVGFDIYSTVRNGVTIDAEAFAALRTVGGAARLYEINLLTGKAYSRGAFAGENAPVDIAIPLGQR